MGGVAPPHSPVATALTPIIASKDNILESLGEEHSHYMFICSRVLLDVTSPNLIEQSSFRILTTYEFHR